MMRNIVPATSPVSRKRADIRIAFTTLQTWPADNLFEDEKRTGTTF